LKSIFSEFAVNAFGVPIARFFGATRRMGVHMI
jgi:hypothetical protein